MYHLTNNVSFFKTKGNSSTNLSISFETVTFFLAGSAECHTRGRRNIAEEVVAGLNLVEQQELPLKSDGVYETCAE